MASASVLTETAQRRPAEAGGPRKTATTPPIVTPAPASPTQPRALLVKPEYLPFAKQLRAWLQDRQMRPADLARAIWGTVPDPRGYDVARNRDRIGTYLAGTGYPTQETMTKLAQALGVDVGDFPIPQRRSRPTVVQGPSDVAIAVQPDSNSAMLTVRCLVSVKTAMAVLTMIQEDPLRIAAAEAAAEIGK